MPNQADVSASDSASSVQNEQNEALVDNPTFVNQDGVAISLDTIPDDNSINNHKIPQKRLNVKIIDPTLPIVNYKIQKRYLLSFGAIPKKKEVLAKANNSVATTLVHKINESDTQLAKNQPTKQTKSRNTFITLVLALIVLCLFGMGTYGIVDAVVIYSQWSYMINSGQNTLGASNAALTYVQNWSSIFFYQYFFGSSTYGLTVNLPTVALGSLTQSNIDNFTNFSLSGFGLFSVYKFNNFSSSAFQSVLQTSVGTQIFYSFLIQICYSLFGLWLAVILRFAPAENKSKLAWSLIFVACLWIIA